MRLLSSFHKNFFIFSLLGVLFIGVQAFLYFFATQHDGYVLTSFIYLSPHFHSVPLHVSLALSAFTFFITWLFLRRNLIRPSRHSFLILIAAFLVAGSFALFTHPLRSQDLYWHLLLTRGAFLDGLNPYTITLHDFFDDSHSYLVPVWRQLSMTHGPLWTLFLTFIHSFTSWNQALFLVKLSFLIALLIGGFVLWKIMHFQGFASDRAFSILTLLAFNPFVLQSGVIDGHSDVFILLSVLLSYYFLLQKNFTYSFFSLLLGGFIKFVPWLLVPIPLFLGVTHYKNFLERLRFLSFVTFTAIICFFIFYFPFGITPFSSSGFIDEILAREAPQFSLLGTTLFTRAFDFSVPEFRVLSIVFGFLIMAFFLRQKKHLLAYTMPYVFILFFTTPWVAPWYGFWFLPLTALLLPLKGSFLLSLLLFLSVDVFSPFEASVIGVLLAVLYLVIRFFFYRGETKD